MPGVVLVLDVEIIAAATSWEVRSPGLSSHCLGEISSLIQQNLAVKSSRHPQSGLGAAHSRLFPGFAPGGPLAPTAWNSGGVGDPIPHP